MQCNIGSGLYQREPTLDGTVEEETFTTEGETDSNDEYTSDEDMLFAGILSPPQPITPE